MFSTLILGLLTLTRKHKLLMDYMLLLRREARIKSAKIICLCRRFNNDNKLQFSGILLVFLALPTSDFIVDSPITVH